MVELLFLLPFTFLSMSHASKEAVLFPHSPLGPLLVRGSLQKEPYKFYLLSAGGSVSGGIKGPPGALCPWRRGYMSSTGSSGQLAFLVPRSTRSCSGCYFCLLSQEKRTRALLVPAATLMDFYQEQLCACTPHSHPPPPR